MEFFKLDLKISIETCFFLLKLYSNVYDVYLFLEIIENKNAEYLIPTV